MLTYAIGFIQNVQLTCFAVVLVLMAAKDRTNRSLRWFACAYVSGLVGGIFQMGEHLLPDWVSLTFGTLAAPIGYACIHASIVYFVSRGTRTRWASLVLIFGSLPCYLFWSLPHASHHFEYIDRIVTLADFTLAVQTSLSGWLLLSTRDEETAWPRRVMGAFLFVYSAVEFSRVAVFLVTGHTPDKTAPWIEVASGIVYVVSCSVLPMAFIWMMNARMHAHMARQMTTDPLTHLLNRRGIQNALELELARYLREKQDFAVALVDIDHFKRLNDTFGHAGGDAVLSETAMLLRSLLRDCDTIGRLGGEEFVLLLPGTALAGATKLVERLRIGMAGHAFQISDDQTSVTASFGVTGTAGRTNLGWGMLLDEADLALYAAKRAGRNLSRVYSAELAHLQQPALS